MITRVIQLIKEEQRKIADNAMAFPDSSRYESWVGKHHGLQEALKIIDEVLQGDEEN